MISAILAAMALAAFCATFLVARFSRWRWVSPWLTICVLTGAALLFASGAADGHWPVCVAAVVVSVMQARVGRLQARARRRITQALAGQAAGGHRA